MMEKSKRQMNSTYSIIHELIFTLSGFDSGLFKFENGIYEINGALPLTPGENKLIEKVLKIATNYRRLKNFSEDNCNPIYSQSTHKYGTNTKVYFLALCSGIEEVLEPYRKAIVHLENEILLDPSKSIMFVLQITEEYTVLLHLLNYAVDQIELKGNDLNWCHIMEILQSSPCVRSHNSEVAFKRIQKRCHSIFLKQLSVWLIYGELFDTEQFFITKDQREDIPGEVEMVHINSVANMYTAYSVFKMNPSQLPSYIPSSLALDILYIGQTVVMIKQKPSNAKSLYEHDEHQDFDIWSGKEKDYLSELREIEDGDSFQIERLKLLVKSMRQHLTNVLWNVAVKDADLLSEIKTVKDLLLLGRGEIVSEFIKMANPILKQPPNTSRLRAAQKSLKEAICSISTRDEVLLNKFIMYFQLDCDLTGWDCIALKFQVKWPLHLLFTEDMLGKYNSVFRLLLKVRRAQSNLLEVWKRQMEDKKIRGCEANTQLGQLRRNFQFVIDNLHHYLQFDVIEVQFSQLIKSIKETDSFEEIKNFHCLAIANILTQAFLQTAVKQEGLVQSQHAVMNCLQTFLDMNFEFCEFAMQAIEGVQPSSNGIESKLCELEHNFMSQVGVLKNMLTIVQCQTSALALSQLLLRLDVNDWLKKNVIS
ncbi:gamma-tubulin complex component 4 isoform X2 [Cloeon dipterum]|uniref:gamma-tubulin complex component 4 isoform X2 n=1 Tax=Cloeon dipterum TaxID=197152 RepID=UPI0032209A03